MRPARPGGQASLLLQAPAKINLNLLVGPVGPDGYHPLDSYVVRLLWGDPVTLHARGDGQIVLECTGSDCGPDEENLAVRAARLAQQILRPAGLGVTIQLDKQIPPGMGLGGGSSDAATVLMGLAELWSTSWQADDLESAAVSLGADVPLFLSPSPAMRMTGRGERLEPVQIAPLVVLLILPRLFCSTGAVYREFDSAPAPQAQQLPAKVLKRRPSFWQSELVNHLQAPARAVCPELAQLQDELQSELPIPVHMTGSGAGLFCLPKDELQARKCQTLIAGRELETVICRTQQAGQGAKGLHFFH
ncbi:MAG: 4-(cytidine 5'-diphospho)-2-C-methyl-D-erythritol kinase [Phycisphaerae bacterium]